MMAEEKSAQVMEEKTVAMPAEQPDTKKKAPAKRRSTKKVENKSKFVKSKRKRSVARASSKSGNGRIRLNGFDIFVFEPIQLRRLMLEPVYVSKITQDAAKHLDIDINVYGGGM